MTRTQSGTGGLARLNDTLWRTAPWGIDMAMTFFADGARSPVRSLYVTFCAPERSSR